MREPAIFYWPGKIKAGVVMDMATSMDFYQLLQLAGAKLPNDRVYDGFDISSIVFGTGLDPRDVVFIIGASGICCS